jgi:predicted HTH domain antitoxin
MKTTHVAGVETVAPEAIAVRNSIIVKMHKNLPVTLQDIADTVGLTRERVRQILRKQGVPVQLSRALRDVRVATRRAERHSLIEKKKAQRRRAQQNKIDKAIEYYEQGYGYIMAAEQAGIAWTTLKKHVVRRGIKRHPTGYTKELREKRKNLNQPRLVA